MIPSIFWESIATCIIMVVFIEYHHYLEKQIKVL